MYVEYHTHLQLQKISTYYERPTLVVEAWLAMGGLLRTAHFISSIFGYPTMTDQMGFFINEKYCKEQIYTWVKAYSIG